MKVCQEYPFFGMSGISSWLPGGGGAAKGIDNSNKSTKEQNDEASKRRSSSLDRGSQSNSTKNANNSSSLIPNLSYFSSWMPHGDKDQSANVKSRKETN